MDRRHWRLLGGKVYVAAGRRTRDLHGLGGRRAEPLLGSRQWRLCDARHRQKLALERQLLQHHRLLRLRNEVPCLYFLWQKMSGPGYVVFENLNSWQMKVVLQFYRQTATDVKRDTRTDITELCEMLSDLYQRRRDYVTQESFTWLLSHISSQASFIQINVSFKSSCFLSNYWHFLNKHDERTKPKHCEDSKRHVTKQRHDKTRWLVTKYLLLWLLWLTYKDATKCYLGKVVYRVQEFQNEVRFISIRIMESRRIFFLGTVFWNEKQILSKRRTFNKVKKLLLFWKLAFKTARRYLTI